MNCQEITKIISGESGYPPVRCDAPGIEYCRPDLTAGCSHALEDVDWLTKDQIMVILATPDWTAGHALQRLLIVWAVVLAISAVGIILGARLLRGKSSVGKRCAGCLLLLVSCLLPIFCYSTHLVGYDKRPLGSSASKQIMEGMSGDEVKAILGMPHQRNKNNDGETWIYWIDSYDGYRFGVNFGPNGRVTDMYGN